jgi:hypothetical protein
LRTGWRTRPSENPANALSIAAIRRSQHNKSPTRSSLRYITIKIVPQAAEQNMMIDDG